MLWEGQSLQSILRRGWYFGSQAFREKLLDRLAMGSAPYVSRLAREMVQRIVVGDRSKRRLKNTIIATILT